MKKSIFGMKLTRKEMRSALKPKKLIIAALGALAIHFVILAPFQGLWEGWFVVISTIGGIVAGEYLD